MAINGAGILYSTKIVIFGIVAIVVVIVAYGGLNVVVMITPIAVICRCAAGNKHTHADCKETIYKATIFHGDFPVTGFWQGIRAWVYLIYYSKSLKQFPRLRWRIRPQS